MQRMILIFVLQRVATDFMMEADPEHPGGFLAPSGGFKGLIHNGCAFLYLLPSACCPGIPSKRGQGLHPMMTGKSVC